jgi:geranylgeranyl diphosphate synthase type II
MIAAAADMGGAGIVPQVLDEYGAVTRAVLQRYLAPRPPEKHLYDLVADYPRRGGRMLRPSLCIATARVFGASVEDAVHSAAALELLHNAFLVHDDVEDESEERRGRPTLHALHGVPVAVNVGDALALLGLRALMDNRASLGPRVTMRVLEEAERMARESIEGQAIELGWRRDNAVDLAETDYLGMVLKKTCWYTTIYPSRIGALIATRSEDGLDRFVQFGFFLGAAFQIQDDLLNLVGDGRRYGKELGGDVWEGKRTLMLIHLLREAAPDDRDRVCAFLSRSRARRRVSDVAWVRRRMEAYGSIDHARRVAHALAGAAQHEYEALYAGLPDSRDRQFIAALPEWVLARN